MDQPGDKELTDKSSVRRLLRARRARIAETTRAVWGADMVRQFMTLSLPDKPGHYLLYVAVGDEAPTRLLAERLLDEGHTVCMPRLDKQRRGEMDVVPVPSWDVLVPGPFFDIPQPPPDTAPIDPAMLDVVLVPGVGFDKAGRRLGQGGGYYDRFLVGLPQGVFRVGWAFSVQVVAKLPHEAHDQGVSFIVTESGIIDCRGGELHS